MAPPLRGRFQVVVRIAGGLRAAATSAASRRMRRILLLQCVAAAPASRSPHLWRTTPTAAATPAGLWPPLGRCRTGRSAAAADRTKRCGESACNECFTSTLEACSGYRSNRTRSEAEHQNQLYAVDGFCPISTTPSCAWRPCRRAIRRFEAGRLACFGSSVWCPWAAARHRSITWPLQA